MKMRHRGSRAAFFHLREIIKCILSKGAIIERWIRRIHEEYHSVKPGLIRYPENRWIGLETIDHKEFL